MSRDNFRHPKPAAVSGPNDAAKIFIGGLHKETTDNDMRTYFSQFGNVIDSVVKRDTASGNSRGFGFVQFSDVESVDRVMDAKPHTIQGKTVDTKRTKSKASLNSCSKIFVGGLDPSMPEEEIRTYFERFGTVESMELPYDRERNIRRGFCFVSFEDPDAVEVICTTAKHRLGSREVDVKRATTKDQRMQSMNMANMMRPGGPGGDPYGGMVAAAAAAANPWAVGYPGFANYDYSAYYAQQAAQYAAFNSQVQQAANGPYATAGGQDPYAQQAPNPQAPYYTAGQPAIQAGVPAGYDYGAYYGGQQAQHGASQGSKGGQQNGSVHKSSRSQEDRRYQPY